MTESKIRSADNLIIKAENEKLGKIAPVEEKVNTEESPPPQNTETKSADDEKNIPSDETGKEEKEEGTKEQDSEKEKPEENASDESSDNSDTDEYGNTIDKPKMYTEEEVQAMIRKRLRDRHETQTPQQQQQMNDAAKDFKADPNSEETWEVQLEKFVENTITKVAERQKQKEWEKSEQLTQAEFEDKFTRGMQRYKDFETVVRDKPISTAMMMATRGMDDPAAFLYAACKQHPQELERIAQIKDPYAQTASIGRLEERMKKAKLVTTAPKPSRKITGDASDKMPERSIDQLIASHAKSKIMRK